MNTGDAYFLVLYVVSVFQPITRDDLFAEAIKTIKSPGEDGLDRRATSEALKQLVRRQLVIEDQGLLSCTVLGNQRAAKLGLRKVRDKNRLFFLKNLLRREYNVR
jgi:hypothetical protein